jgi:hypothetical protein
MDRFVLALMLSLVAPACQESARAEAELSAAAPAVSAAPVPAASSSAPAAAPAATAVAPDAPSSHHEDAFHLDLVVPAKVAANAPFEVLVRLEAKSGYKVNQEYPIKFVAESGPSLLSLEPGTLRKEQGTLFEKKAELRGRSQAKAAGPARLLGRLSFSVCTAERCLIEKRDLGATVTAAPAP